ncbi:MAG TPA: hypothetical protein PKA48_06675 [Candidatus Obscuribacter sp.]|nr:hypothetical protein [Candidatus Obscuribacter sp.]
MSYDFHIFLQNEPRLPEIISALTQFKLSVEHSPTALPWQFDCYVGERDGNEIVDKPCLKVVGPISVFPDDLPTFSTNDLDRCKWKLEVSSRMEPDFLELAGKFGAFLVKSHKGTVYDPQDDQLIFPKKVLRKADSREIKLLSIQWLTSDEDFLSSKVKTLLATLQEMMPEALPMRFGRCLPFTEKLVSAGQPGFIAACRKEGTVFWRGRYPTLGGAIWRPSEFTRMKSSELPCVSVTLDFDCSWVTASSENADRVAALFANLAEGMGCFYAGAAVRRRVTLVDGEVFLGPDAENWSFGRAACWDGIPLVKTWLTWFGSELKEEVAPVLDSRYVSMEGSFMRLSDKPMDADELNYLFPKLPDRVLNIETASGLFRKSLS